MSDGRSVSGLVPSPIEPEIRSVSSGCVMKEPRVLRCGLLARRGSADSRDFEGPR